MDGRVLIYFLLIGILCTTTFCAYMVFKHYDLYNNDPLVFGAKKYNLSTCLCSTNQGDALEFNQEQIIIRKSPVSPGRIEVKF